MSQQISQEKEKNSKKDPAKSKLGFQKLSKKAKPQKAEEKTKQVSKPKEQKKENQKHSGKPTFMQSLHVIFEKKQIQETDMVIFKEPSATAQEIETYEINPSYSKVTIMSLPELGGGKSYFISEVKLTPDLTGFAYKHFSWMGNIFAKLFYSTKKLKLDQTLEVAGIKTYPDAYYSLIGFVFIIVFAALIPVAVLTGLYPILLVPLSVILFGAMIPKIKARDRAAKLDIEVPFAGTYISTMATGGYLRMTACED